MTTMQSLLLLASLVHPVVAETEHPVDTLLFRYGGPFTLEWLENHLRSEDTSTRRDAASGFAALGADSQASLPSLVQALSDEDQYVRTFALCAIANCGQNAKWALPEVTTLLDDVDAFVREQAVWTVVGLSPGSAKLVRKLVFMLDHDPDFEVRMAVAQALGRVVGDAATPAVGRLVAIADLDERAPTIREDGHGTQELVLRIAAATSLGRISCDPRAVPWLTDVVNNKDTQWYVREFAVTGLADIGSATEETLRVLCEAVQLWKSGMEGGEVGSAAIRALGRIARAPDVVVPVLLPVVEEPWMPRGGYNYQAFWSLEAIGKVRPPTPVALECLEGALTFRDEAARLTAAQSLVSMGSRRREIVCVLIDLLKLDVSPIPVFHGFAGRLRAACVRRDAAVVLGQLGVAARDALPALHTVAESDEFQSVREAATEALGRIGVGTCGG